MTGDNHLEDVYWMVLLEVIHSLSIYSQYSSNLTPVIPTTSSLSDKLIVHETSHPASLQIHLPSHNYLLPIPLLHLQLAPQSRHPLHYSASRSRCHEKSYNASKDPRSRRSAGSRCYRGRRVVLVVAFFCVFRRPDNWWGVEGSESCNVFSMFCASAVEDRLLILLSR